MLPLPISACRVIGRIELGYKMAGNLSRRTELGLLDSVEPHIRKLGRPWYDRAELISTGQFGSLCSDIVKEYNVV